MSAGLAEQGLLILLLANRVDRKLLAFLTGNGLPKDGAGKINLLDGLGGWKALRTVPSTEADAAIAHRSPFPVVQEFVCLRRCECRSAKRNRTAIATKGDTKLDAMYPAGSAARNARIAPLMARCWKPSDGGCMANVVSAAERNVASQRADRADSHGSRVENPGESDARYPGERRTAERESEPGERDGVCGEFAMDPKFLKLVS